MGHHRHALATAEIREIIAALRTEELEALVFVGRRLLVTRQRLRPVLRGEPHAAREALAAGVDGILSAIAAAAVAGISV